MASPIAGTPVGCCKREKKTWREFSASPVYCDGEIYAANLRGETFVFRANKNLYQMTAMNVLGSDAYASPAICDGQIFMRVGSEEEGHRQEWLYCLGGPHFQTPKERITAAIRVAERVGQAEFLFF